MSAARPLSVLRDTLVRQFRAAGFSDPVAEAALVLDLAGFDRLTMLRDPDAEAGPEALARINTIAARRLGGTPPARIIGMAAFFGREFRVGPDTLDPRSDTETLIEALDRPIRERIARNGRARIADVGTGTGAIAITLALEHPRLSVVATDIARGAVAVARDNARRLDVAGRVRVVQADLLDPRAVPGRFDVIVSNPPYIARAVCGGLDESVRHHDPLRALDGGLDGLDFYRRLAEIAPNRLISGGLLAVEIGYDQRRAVSSVFAERGFRIIETRRDAGGRDRVVIARPLRLR